MVVAEVPVGVATADPAPLSATGDLAPLIAARDPAPPAPPTAMAAGLAGEEVVGTMVGTATGTVIAAPEIAMVGTTGVTVTGVALPPRPGDHAPRLARTGILHLAWASAVLWGVAWGVGQGGPRVVVGMEWHRPLHHSPGAPRQAVELRWEWAAGALGLDLQVGHLAPRGG